LKIENRNKLILILIIFASLGIKMVIVDLDNQLEKDARLYYFQALNYIFDKGLQPPEYETLHNEGFPIVLSALFYAFEPEYETQNIDRLFYQNVQRIFTIVLSCALIPLAYLLSREFYKEKIALIGAAIIAFEPHLIQNSIMGITEPLFLILVFLTFINMFKNNLFFAFLFAVFSMFIRFEGIVLFPIIFVWFIKSYNYKKTVIAVLLLLVLMVPILIIEDNGIMKKIDKETRNLENFSKGKITIEALGNSLLYMAWVSFPIFIFFLPYGFYKVKDRIFFLFATIVLMIPPIWAYLDAYDTRYFFIAFPILLLVSLASVKKIFRYSYKVIHSK
jgi:hypothetical protein